MSKRYFNDTAYPFIQGNTRPTYTFTIYDSTGAPANFSSFPSIVVTARFREEGATTSLAVITCDEVNKAIGKFKITTWPAAVAAANEGVHELEIEVDYAGDDTLVERVYHLVKFKVYEKFGDTA